MANQKFTPGPWWIENPNDKCSADMGIHGAHDGACFVIADICNDGFCLESTQANARLIAAAPELYEAAAAVAALYADEPGDELDPAWAVLRAALAKAVSP